MNTSFQIQLQGIALNAEGGSASAVPEWVQLTPAGPEIASRDGRKFRLTDPEAVIERFAQANQPLVIDIDHASEKARTGDPAPAQGWIEAMEVREGALWGRVNWNSSGRALMEQQAYRYLSPVLIVSKLTGEVHSLRSAALVHRPNLEMAALNSQTEDDEEILPMDEAIRQALGLPAGATSADAIVAINQMKSDTTAALNSAQHPDPDLFVPKADHDVALNELLDLRQFKEGAEEAAMNAAVDAAISAGKFAPASRDYHLNSCKAMGLDKFQTYVSGLPSLTGEQPKPKSDLKPATALNSEDTYAMEQLGLSAEAFTAAKEA